MNRMKVEPIAYAEAKPFILNIHYSRRMPCIQYAFGLFDGSYPFPIGVVTYGQPASPSLCKGLAGESNKRHVLELNRLVLYPEYNGKNYASFLVSHSLKQLPEKTFVVSYADIDSWGHVGYIYQATNFLYTGKTKPRTDLCSTDGHHSRHYKKGETNRQYRSGKYRYVYLVGNKKQRKEMMNQLQYPVIEEYPKGESIHYDLKNPKALKGESNEQE